MYKQFICKNPQCRKKFIGRTARKYCCKACDHTCRKGKAKPKWFGKKISQALAGKPKPWNCGSRNVNYKNKIQGRPDIHARFLRAVKIRGQQWTKKHRDAHSVRMLGSSNKMRGRHHTAETKQKISRKKKYLYAHGLVNHKRYKRSKAERAIGRFIKQKGIEFIPQYMILGVPYRYDFYIPSKNLILEYQGNYWHGNPKKYPPGSFINMQVTGLIPVEDLWKRDARKCKLAIRRGYRVRYIWESDYAQSGNNLVEEAIKCA